MIARFAIPFFMLMTIVVVPAAVYLLCARLLPRRYGRKVGMAIAVILEGMVLMGFFTGFSDSVVRHEEFVSSDVPEAFDGYRIVQFSDAHVGTLSGWRESLLRFAVDDINSQQPDLIVFTGDMQNIWPGELDEHIPVMRRLKARDGVMAVLGNHDYAVYQDCDSLQKERNCRRTADAIRRMGFDLLLNEHRVIRRGGDSIIIGGMENWGKARRMPKKGDVAKTLGHHPTPNTQHPSPNTHHPLTIILQHDPTAWREKILPECDAQLTLSGHTHGAQLGILGWSPASLLYREWGGMTWEGQRAINVSTGVGSLVPWRLGMPREIVVITLRKAE